MKELKRYKVGRCGKVSYKEIKEKYEKTLAKFGINGRIESVTGAELPIQAIKERDDEITIYLNLIIAKRG